MELGLKPGATADRGAAQRPTVVAVIPALDEEGAIGAVVAALPRELVDRVIVVDNGSRDRTADRARAAGADVLHEPRRGYGHACLTAIAAAREADVLVFLDGDGSDDPAEVPRVVGPVLAGAADLVVGSRVQGRAEPGSLTPVQRFGNALTCALVRALWGVRWTDLGPLRAIRRDALLRLEMADPAHGWTIEMQVKAAQRGLRCAEVPVTHRRRRAGRSKVSGTVRGSWLAGRRILGYVAAAALRDGLDRAASAAAALRERIGAARLGATARLSRRRAPGRPARP